MPPRPAKKPSGGSAGPKKAMVRTARGLPKATSQVEVAEDAMKAGVPVPVAEVREGFKAVEAVREKPIVLDSGANKPGLVNAEYATASAKPVDMPTPKNASRALSNPHTQSTAGSSNYSAPMMPPKGDTSRPFTLQFGTINPGIMNGMQIPARTSSAPPNLDEQKRDQARHEPFRAVPGVPISSASKQQQQQQQQEVRKDIGGASRSSIVESHSQVKRDVHVPVPSGPTVAPPKSTVLPMTGLPVHMPFQHQQPQVPLQFGGPNTQMQPQGLAANSLQMPMTLPVGSTTQVPQTIFVPGHLLQQQAMMHQGQGLGFAPPIGHQLATPQLGNLGMGITSQFHLQQQPSKFGGTRKTTVKITHPETHEELRLDKRTDAFKDGISSGQRSLPNLISQSQPVATYASSHQMNYYSSIQPNSYNPSQIIFPTSTSVPLASSQMPTSSQVPRYNYPVSQTGQPLSFTSPSVLNSMPAGKPGPQTAVHGVTEGTNLDGLLVSAPSGPVPVTLKPPIAAQVEKASVTINIPVSIADSPKLLKPASDVAASFHRHSEILPVGLVKQAESVTVPKQNVSLPSTERHSSAVPLVLPPRIALPEASSSAPATLGDSVSIHVENDCNKREPVRRSDSLKDSQKKTNKKDLRHLQQLHHADASNLAESGKLSSWKIIKDTFVGEVISQELSTNFENKAIEDKAVLAVPHSSGEILEKKAVQDAPLVSVNAFGLASGVVSVTESEIAEPPMSLGHFVDRAVVKNFNTGLTLDNECIYVRSSKERIFEGIIIEHSEVSDDFSQDLPDANVHPASIIKYSSEIASPVTVVMQNDGDIEKTGKAKISEHAVKKEELGISNEAVGYARDEDRMTDEQDRPVDTSLDLSQAESPCSSHHVYDSSVTNEPLVLDSLSTKREVMLNEQDVGLTDSFMTSLGRDPVPDSTASQVAWKVEVKVPELSTGGLVSAISSSPKEKPLEASKPKNSAGKKKKKIKEILSKADAAGTSDLYNAYKGPEEKHQVSTSESVDGSLPTDAKNGSIDDTNNEVIASEEDGLNKSELDDWEYAADLSTPRLKTTEQAPSTNGKRKQYEEDGSEATIRKKYSRDFLLTFSQQFTELPVGFEIGSDIADALMSVPVTKSRVIDREPYPTSVRIIDRPSGASLVDRRAVGNMDDDKWVKSPGPLGPGRDLRLDAGHGASVVSLRPGQGGNHGVLRNPRGQSSNHFTGGILSGPQSVVSQGGMPRPNSDADRWQRANSIQRGLIPSPQTPLPVMHKAEKKYEVGKVTDEGEAKQRQLKAILNKLTPQNFEKLFAQVKEVNIDSADTLRGVISQIFDKALMEPTFCEMYADFCFHLAGALPDFCEDNEKITFRRLLLNKCQEEFEQGEREQAEANKVEEEGEVKQSEEEREEKRVRARRRMLGNIRLIGELYKKKMLTERIMHECIKKLLGQYENPDEEDVEALCKLMSTIGEIIDHPRAKEHMDKYFEMMAKLSTNQKLSSRVRFMLRDAIDLRKNKWQQRRKVEGPKKIEEVHRDAAQEKQAQASRLSRGPVIGSVPRRGPAIDYGLRASTPLTSPSPQQVVGTRGLPPQVRGYGTQDVRLEDRHQFESRTLTLPLPQRSTDEDSITLGPQGGLARGMSIRGQPLMPNVPTADTAIVGEHCRMPSGQNGYNAVSDWTPYNSREETTTRVSRMSDRASDRSSTTIFPVGRTHSTSGSSQASIFETRMFSEEVLREKSMLAIKEFYSAMDEEEVSLCIKELNAPSYYSTMISLWVTDSFERKDMERDLLAKLIVSLCKSQDSLVSRVQLILGFEYVLSLLEDAVNDAPRAPEFLGRIFAKIILEDVVPLKEIGRLLHEGGEEPGGLLKSGLAADVLCCILEAIRSDKGDYFMKQILLSSNLVLEEFQSPDLINKSKKLDAFL